MSKEYPLYPKLSEEAQEEAQQLIDNFKEQLKKAADDAISDLHCNIVPYIESDSWTNFANELMDGFRDYNNSKIQNKYDFKQIRQKIYEEYKEELIKDLDQDLLKEIESLKDQLKFERNLKRY